MDWTLFIPSAIKKNYLKRNYIEIASITGLLSFFDDWKGREIEEETEFQTPGSFPKCQQEPSEADSRYPVWGTAIQLLSHHCWLPGSAIGGNRSHGPAPHIKPTHSIAAYEFLGQISAPTTGFKATFLVFLIDKNSHLPIDKNS